MENGIVISTVRTAKFWIGGTAVIDLITRLPEDILTPLLSLVGGVYGSGGVGTFTTWLLFAVVFYTFTPLIYSYLEALPSEQVGYRLLFTAAAVLSGLVLKYLDGEGLLIGVFAAVAVGSSTLLWYLSRFQHWSLLSVNGRAVSLLQTIFPHEDISDELETDLSRQGFAGLVGRILFLAAVGVILGFPIFLAGVVSQVFIYAYPIPNLAFLGWAFATAVSPHLTIGPTRRQVLDREFDLEKYLLDALEYSSRSVQGLFTTTFCVLGILISAGYLWLAIRAATELSDLYSVMLRRPLFELGVEEWIILSGLTGFTALLGFVGVFSMWAWIRELQRLPHFLDEWENRTTISGDPLARPIGFLVLPLTTAGVTGIYGFYLTIPGTTVVEYAFAGGWPILLVLGWWGSNHPKRPQPIRYENLWITAGLYFEVSSVWLVAQLVGGPSGSTSDLLRKVLSSPEVPLILAVVTLLPTLLPYVSRYENRRADGVSYAMVWILFVIASTTFGGSLLTSGPLRVQLFVLAGASGVGGVALVTVRYLEI